MSCLKPSLSLSISDVQKSYKKFQRFHCNNDITHYTHGRSFVVPTYLIVCLCTLLGPKIQMSTICMSPLIRTWLCMRKWTTDGALGQREHGQWWEAGEHRGWKFNQKEEEEEAWRNQNNAIYPWYVHIQYFCFYFLVIQLSLPIVVFGWGWHLQGSLS